MKTATMLHHPMMAPRELKKAAAIMHGFINDRYSKGLLTGEEAELLSLEVTQLLSSITWPRCSCAGCGAKHEWN